MLNIEIDGKKLQAQEGSMVIEAADAAGIYIPRFCYHKKLSVAANCRMCLVDVEKVAKPLPACATPVTEGMRIFTRSEKTLNAQRGVMEFLLINHPLDCPICDQGGECDLQDLAVGYGKDVSRYTENKRIVKDKNIGPLIATDMTRCIHCTRCVRFGQEIAGIMELGATGRGEHMRIGTYIERSVDSELSGNMIDLCPVGALTSKPFRYSARPWELKDMPSVSPHDCVGSNLNVQVRRNEVMRVLPRENEDVNEVWISDRDRFSYDAVNNKEARLLRPMIRSNGQWQETDWRTALEFAAGGLRKIVGGHGADQLGALAAPQSTVEELYLLQKLVRKLGSSNVDHRLRARDMSDDAQAPAFPWLGQSIRELESLDAALLIGAYTRKDQPLINHRLRKASLNGAKITAVNPVDWSFNFPLHAKSIGTPAQMLTALGGIAKALSKQAGQPLPAAAESWAAAIEIGASEQAIAHALQNGTRKAVLLGSFAASHPAAASVRALAELIAGLSGAKLGHLPEANSVGAWLAGCVPHRGPAGETVTKPGRDAYAMLATPLKGYIVLGAEPELDGWDGAQARRALSEAEFVISLSPFKTKATDYADVLLPVAPFTETSGTFVNCEGRWQSFGGAVVPAGDARPAWKVLRVLGNLLELPGFEYSSSEEVLSEVKRDVVPSAKLRQWALTAPRLDTAEVVRVLEVPIYAADGIVRRSRPLSQTADHQRPSVRMNAALSAKLGLAAESAARVEVGEGQAVLDVVIDSCVPDGCVVVPSGFSETATLSAYGAARISRT